ncbi:MAG: hypothetical protein R2704_06005 [Microthrixaceae bacterium]
MSIPATTHPAPKRCRCRTGANGAPPQVLEGEHRPVVRRRSRPDAGGAVADDGGAGTRRFRW